MHLLQNFTKAKRILGCHMNELIDLIFTGHLLFCLVLLCFHALFMALFDRKYFRVSNELLQAVELQFMGLKAAD